MEYKISKCRTKNIYMTDEAKQHILILQENCINLSAFIRKCLKEKAEELSNS